MWIKWKKWWIPIFWWAAILDFLLRLRFCRWQHWLRSKILGSAREELRPVNRVIFRMRATWTSIASCNMKTNAVLIFFCLLEFPLEDIGWHYRLKQCVTSYRWNIFIHPPGAYSNRQARFHSPPIIFICPLSFVIHCSEFLQTILLLKPFIFTDNPWLLYSTHVAPNIDWHHRPVIAHSHSL